MKNYILFLTIGLLLSCAGRNQSGDTSEKADQSVEVESITKNTPTEVEESNAESFGLIGKWTIPSSFGGGELKIEHHLGKYYKNEELNDGTVNISEMVMKEEGGMKIFSLKDQSSQDTWVITESGRLEVRGKDGVIYSSEAI
ncbi:hypothetical protein [Shivajiella indica]|uniref:Lipocalin-like domain-containing protein n=1 Tax=Shivajiella indica TaxID=872115 RepID=A0ABW5B1V5_9BACT